jgi:hypothetical protein
MNDTYRPSGRVNQYLLSQTWNNKLNVVYLHFDPRDNVTAVIFHHQKHGQTFIVIKYLFGQSRFHIDATDVQVKFLIHFLGVGCGCQLRCPNGDSSNRNLNTTPMLIFAVFVVTMNYLQLKWRGIILTNQSDIKSIFVTVLTCTRYSTPKYLFLGFSSKLCCRETENGWSSGRLSRNGSKITSGKNFFCFTTSSYGEGR